MSIFGSIAVVRAQTEGRAGFAQAFAYLDEIYREGSEARTRMLAQTSGTIYRVELAGGVFAMEQGYDTRVRPGAFESHRKYIDIQCLVVGAELMEVADIAKLPVTEAYDAERDVIIYGDFLDTSVLRISAGEAAVYFPEDGHMPNLRVGADAAFVRKTVVKVPV